MTTPDELERAVERLHELAKAASDGPWTYERCIRSGFEVWGRYAASIVSSDELARHGAISREDDAAFIAAANPATILALLSERAELLATVRRQGEALKLAREIFADMIRYGKVFSGEGPAPYGSYYIGEGALETLMRDEPRAALTTGEGK